MIALAAALLASTHPQGTLALYGATPATPGDVQVKHRALSFAVRSFDHDFDVFNRQVLCCAVSPCSTMSRQRLALVVEDSREVMARYGTARLSELRRELACWVAVLMPGSASQCRRIEALATAALLSNAHVQCAYRLPPVSVHAARPIVVVQLGILQSIGRERFLHALWESQCAAGTATGSDAADQDRPGLYDSLRDRLSSASLND